MDRDTQPGGGPLSEQGLKGGPRARAGAGQGAGGSAGGSAGGRIGQGELFAGQPRSFALPRPDADRIGVVDVGSNSVRMVVFEGGRRCPAMVFNEKIMCGLGAELAATGRLSARGRERAMRALTRFVTLAPGLRIGALAAVATAAVREAADGPDFRDEVARETGIRLQIATGEDEARLAAQGVLFGNPGARGLVIDLGGASMELCQVSRGRTGRGVSTPLGPQRLGDLSKGTDKARAMIDEALGPLVAGFARSSERLYLVGGAWRSLGRVEISRTAHPLQVLHEHAFSPEDGHLVARWILGADVGTLGGLPGVSSDRAPTLPHAALLLEGLIDHFAPGEIVISGFGLREGLAWEYLPAHIRRQDPLISTVAGHERTRARAPGFGIELADWILAALPARDPEEERLIRASCHLSDVSWRAHPDYRASACLEVATRINVSSAGHAGRAFIAAALLARYGGPKALGDEPILLLLSPGAVECVAQVGALMRLGCAISGATPGFLPLCPLALADGALRLLPAPEAEPLMGEEVDKRLGQAAKAMGVRAEVVPA